MSADKFPVAITGASNQLILAAPTGNGAFIRVVSYHLTGPAAAVVEHATADTGGTVVCTDYVGAGNQAGAVDTGGVFDLPPNQPYYVVTTATVGGCVRAQVMGAG